MTSHRLSFSFAFVALTAVAAFASLEACGGSASDASPVVATGGDGGGPDGASSSAHPTPQRPAPDSTGPKTWCTEQGAHDFCADFDAPDDPLSGWDDATRGDDPAHKDENGVIASDRSAPNAFHEKGAALPSPEGGQDPTGPFSGMFVSKKLGQVTTTKAHLAFDVRIDQNDDSLGLFELEGRSADGSKIVFNVSLDLSRDAGFFFAATGVESPKIVAPPMGSWVHVEVALDDQGTGNGTATLSFDGKVAGTTQLTGELAKSAATTLYVGVSRTAPSGAYEISYDNVVLDMK